MPDELLLLLEKVGKDEPAATANNALVCVAYSRLDSPSDVCSVTALHAQPILSVAETSPRQ